MSYKNKSAKSKETDVFENTNYKFNVFENIHNNYSILTLHWHEHLEIIKIVEGQATFIIDSKSYEVSPGDILFVKPFQVHSGYSTNNSMVKYYAIVFYRSLIQSMAENYNDKSSITSLNHYFDNEFESNAKIDSNFIHYNEMDYCIKKIISEYYERPTFFELQITNYITTFMINIYRNLLHFHYKNVRKNKSSHANTIQNLISYIYSACPTNMSVEEAAKYVNLSTFYFCKVFKKYTGSTFIHFLNAFKISKSEDLLSYTNATISQIAEKLGYCNLNYFGKIFKEINGCSPSVYRKLNRNIKE